MKSAIWREEKEADKRGTEGKCGKTHVEVSVLVGDLVQVEKGLVHGLLQVQRGLDGVLAAAPLVLGRLLDVLQHDASAAVVLELHEDLRMLQLLGGGLAEVLGEARESHVVSLEVEGLSGEERCENPVGLAGESVLPWKCRCRRRTVPG